MKKEEMTMNSKWHLYTSVSKSIIRIVGCGFAVGLQSITVLGVGLVLAEILGILEELKDER